MSSLSNHLAPQSSWVQVAPYVASIYIGLHTCNNCEISLFIRTAHYKKNFHFQHTLFYTTLCDVTMYHDETNSRKRSALEHKLTPTDEPGAAGRCLGRFRLDSAVALLASPGLGHAPPALGFGAVHCWKAALRPEGRLAVNAMEGRGSCLAVRCGRSCYVSPF